MNDYLNNSEALIV